MNTLTVTELMEGYRVVEVQGRTIWIPWPDRNRSDVFVEREDLVRHALAAWATDDGMGPLNFRLYGPPGCGKTSLVFHLAKKLGSNGVSRGIYIMNGSSSRYTEDIAVTPVMISGRKVVYAGTPLLGAVLFGGICFFDEIAKAPNDTLNQLSELLDEQRTLTSSHAGIRFTAHRDFLFCAALNEDEEKGGRLPSIIDQRLLPSIYVGLPTQEDLERILTAQLPESSKKWVEVFMKDLGKPTSPRSALKLVKYARRISLMDKVRKPRQSDIRSYIKLAENAGEHSTQGV